MFPRPYRPLEHTPNPQPTVYEGILIWGFGDVWGMLQGYVGFPLECSVFKEQKKTTMIYFNSSELQDHETLI